MNDTIILRGKYPCCQGKFKIKALIDIPKQIYDRTCSKCNKKWTVTRTFLTNSKILRMDKLEWEKK